MTTIADLVADPANRRKRTARNLAMIRDALRDVGTARSIVIDEDDVVLAGNGVVEAAQAEGLTRVRVVDADGDELIAVRRSGLSSTQKRALALYDNRTAELAEWNIEQLQADQIGGLDLRPFWTAEEAATLLHTPKRGATDPDAVPEARETSIVRGDLFQLGPHRLLCGDATDAADVARVIDGVPIAVTLTDPPYSVNYDRSRAERGGSAAAHAAYHEAAIDPRALLDGFLARLPSDVLVMSYPVDRHLAALAAALETAAIDVRRECVWIKDSFSFWPSANYQQQHEPILICARRGRPLGGDVPANQSTVFEIPRPRAHDLHPTAKPLALWRVFVTNHAGIGAHVFDPFSGSGTTIMACEELGRVAHAIELAPPYVQVAIDRWEAFTGQTAEKVDDAPRP